jgi:hypothetical protein
VPDLWLGWIAVGVIATVIATFIVALIYRVWADNPVRRWRGRKRAENDARLLLKEFQRRANGNLDYVIAIEGAARRAGVDDPGPAVALLKERGLVEGTEAGTRPIYVRLTPKVLRADENAV